MITHVAIRWDGRIWSLPAPNRHHDIIRKIVEETGARIVDVREDDQGFLVKDSVTGELYFCRRKPALAHALACGQVKDPTKIRLGMLFSEDLW